MDYVLNSENSKIKNVLDSVAQFEVQIRYTHIDRKDDTVYFTDYDFQVDSLNYFYPASTVKFPATVATLEKLKENDSINRNTRFYIEGDSVETTFTKAITEIFAVSNNSANNRLIEFLGQDDLNKRMRNRGIAPIRIAHRLGFDYDDTATRPLVIYLNDSTTANYTGTINATPKPLNINRIQKGIGFYEEDSLMHEPFNFKLKNYYPIQTQHALLKRIIFPEKFAREQRFNLSQEQRDFLLTAMSKTPRQAGYDSDSFYDGYNKFFMFGDTKENIPEHIKIYNKIGGAYGTLTDSAYIIDSKNKVEFMLTATILVNKNGIFNDDDYEYETIGIPFLAELGRQFYSYELTHKENSKQ
ncbi:serine hydrolase [Aurantibacter crassamenti]|uniref:serine hydrolase n=1 Tax=Aurantibacter crassamenti TaxID=1837375 RepID=UPI001EED8681|nr:serine hydrolase [Aurantibacter crassamenti]